MAPEATILNALIARLEPKVGDLARDRRRQGEPLPDGIGHLVQALRMAKDALASGSPEEIRIAALHAPPMERTGNELQEAKRQRDESARRQEEKTAARSVRQKGGKTRGEQQAAAANAEWNSYDDAYNTMLANGKSRREAIRQVNRMITQDGFVLSRTGNPPSPTTIYHRYPKK